MNNPITPEDRLEVLYAQIDAEARTIAKKITKYDPDYDEELGQYKPKQVAYEHIIRWYKAGAVPYGERLAAAEDLIDEMAKVLMAQSNEPTIDDMNKAIAIFDGWEFHKGDPDHKCKFCFAGDDPCTPAVDRFVKDCKVVFHYELKYHTSWDCLKPVIDEIFRYALAHSKEVRPVREMSIVVNIQAAHEKVYKFCKWYNQQKQKNGNA